MQFSRNNLVMSDHFFLRMIQLKIFDSTQNLHHRITSNNCNKVVSPVYAVFDILCWCSIKNEIPEAAMELCQLKIKQLPPDILKLRTKHEENLFTLICSVVSGSFLFIFYSGLRELGSNNFRN